MSGQDIFPDLEKHQSYRTKRRVLFIAALILVGYVATTRILEYLIRLLNGSTPIAWDQQVSSLSRPPPAHLIKTIEQRRSNYQSSSALLGITAIISLALRKERESRAGGLELLLQFLVKYPFVKEIIIWNDDVTSSGLNLNGEDLLSTLKSTDDGAPLPILRVINSPGRMGEMSRHMACSLAKFDTCYHTDENLLNLNLDTLYTKYLESDGESEATIVDHASPEEYVAESAYNLWQPDYSLNAGIVSQLSRGSLAAKRLSTRYFQQLTTALRSPEESDIWLSIPPSVSSDIQFSIWSNRRPLKLITPVQSSLITDSPPTKIAYLDPEFIDNAYGRLNQTIQTSDPFLVPSMFPRALPSHHLKPESEIGLASAYDDRSMLITNLNFSSEWPLAVDGELSTCWKDLSGTEHGSFVGLNFVKNVQLKRLTFFGKVEPENWKLELLSANDQKWISKSVVPKIITHQEPPLTKFVYDTTSTLVKKVRLIIPQGKSNLNGITVCGWMINEDWVV
ncbi:hypothetical protein PtA15_18A256 [Puccinia triticina]|uniref:F5/8 type C domain-containing protein n=1 Tax=Puccinia triticina TaxID=208348 RepID=A0ABY7D7Z5_9BASI|nr:uncharacterized protein PtA15_18A256 [Puccinia triticina]WAQ93198.1 hypothetical protein PtA15_18A256 [Puccinia triticina]